MASFDNNAFDPSAFDEGAFDLDASGAADVRVSWVALDTAAAPCDVKVSWICHDTAATPVDVRVSWIALDTAATPCDVRVSWVCLDTASSDQTTYSAEIVLKPWYVKRKKRIYVFNSAQEADAYIAAEAEAEAAVAKAQKTSRRARKRLRDKLITVEPINTVDIDWLSELIAHFKIQADLAALLAQQDYERVLQIMAMASEMLDEEDIELLLLA